MSNQWRVYNTHPLGYTHKEKFRDEMIEIKAGEYVLMDYEDAVLFRGQFFPIKMDASNQQDPTSYKCIKIEPDDKQAPKVPLAQIRYVCMFDGKEFPTKEELMKYTESNYADRIFKDDVLDEKIKKEEDSRKTKATKG